MAATSFTRFYCGLKSSLSFPSHFNNTLLKTRSVLRFARRRDHQSGVCGDGNLSVKALLCWKGKTTPHGTLHIHSNVDTDVIAVDVHDKTNNEDSSIRFQPENHGKHESHAKSFAASILQTIDVSSKQLSEEGTALKVTALIPQNLNPNGTSKMTIESPHTTSVTVTTLDKRKLSIKSLESSKITVLQSDGGDFIAEKIKCTSLSYNGSGNVTSKTSIISDLDIKVDGCGAVSVGKVQGSVHNIASQNGDVKINSLYCLSAAISSTEGNVALGSSHGNLKVETISGDINIGACEGDQIDIRTERGDIYVTLNEVRNAVVRSEKGDVHVNLGTTFGDDIIHIEAAECEIGKDVNTEQIILNLEDSEGAPDPKVLIFSSHGTCTIKKASWLDGMSLNIIK